jgi:toxin ParE1/3/4
MKNTYLLSKKAGDDLDKIWIYTLENWSLEQADRYYNLIVDEIEYLISDFESGKDFGHVKEGYRGAKVKSHIIFYKKNNQGIIEIIRILHQMMDLENRLK